MYRVAVINSDDGKIAFSAEQFHFAVLGGSTSIAEIQREVLKVAASEGRIRKEDFGKYEVRIESND